jgi:hypothetical protein
MKTFEVHTDLEGLCFFRHNHIAQSFSRGAKRCYAGGMVSEIPFAQDATKAKVPTFDVIGALRRFGVQREYA